VSITNTRTSQQKY